MEAGRPGRALSGQTEAGRSVMRKRPEIRVRQRPMILRMVNGRMPAIIPRIREIVADQ